MTDSSNVIAKVRRSLGRSAPLAQPPVPPELPEPIVRLVHTDFGLPELFTSRAMEMKMLVDGVYVEDLLPRMVEFLREKGVKRVAISVSVLLEKMNVESGLKEAGFDVKRWDAMTLDEMYEYECAVTDATYAVAETGTLVIRASAGQGRSMTLTPMFHVCVLEPKNFLPDLLDLFERLGKEGSGSATVMISGPSKTADIEMNVVTGVHGPNVVKTFILQ